MDKKKILVVEDDEFLREIYHETLSQAGFTIYTAVDGDDAYEKIKAGGWDLILLDIVLPKRDGLEVIKALKSDPGVTITCPVVFLTNIDNQDQIKQALAYGSGYIMKSQVTPGDMVKEVNMYLAKSDTTPAAPEVGGEQKPVEASQGPQPAPQPSEPADDPSKPQES